jgi:hypothetical protein
MMRDLFVLLNEYPLTAAIVFVSAIILLEEIGKAIGKARRP